MEGRKRSSIIFIPVLSTLFFAVDHSMYAFVPLTFVLHARVCIFEVLLAHGCESSAAIDHLAKPVIRNNFHEYY